MAEFNAAHTLDEAQERSKLLAEGQKTVPVMAAVIAVLAALATLFANHSSISGLASKNEAILAMSKAADQYNYYESKRIKVQLNQALISAGAVSSTAGLKSMQALMNKEDAEAANILKDAKGLQASSETDYAASEQYMRGYEKFEVAATLFEVSIVLVSITALMRTKSLLLVAGGASIVGLAFMAQGWLLH